MDRHRERVLGTVGSTFARGCIAHEFAILDEETRAALFIAASPSTHADHAIVLGPIWKSIIGRMNADEAATAGHVGLEVFSHRFRPEFTIVIAYDHSEIGELGPPRIPSGSR